MVADFVKMVNGVAGTFAGMTREARDTARERMKEALGGIDFVSREEFETVKAMAARARADYATLEARIAALEGAGNDPVDPRPADADNSGMPPPAA